MRKLQLILFFLWFGKEIASSSFTPDDIQWKFSRKSLHNDDLCELQLKYFDVEVSERKDWAVKCEEYVLSYDQFFLSINLL